MRRPLPRWSRTSSASPFESVEIVHGDTDKMPFGMGTYGARSLAVGGTAIVKAMDKIIAKGKKIAAHLLEASDTDIDFENGEFTVKGTDKKVTFGQVALTAYVPHNYPARQAGTGARTKPRSTIRSTSPIRAAAISCEVEIDPETGETQVVKFTAVDDFGRVINPMIVDGQVHGGVAQGIGQALLEGCVYDNATGQLLTGSYMDYTMPRADDLPNFQSTTRPRLHPQPARREGCGEAGAIGSPPAFINALTDALGVRDIAMPATVERVWRAANGMPA